MQKRAVKVGVILFYVLLWVSPHDATGELGQERKTAFLEVLGKYVVNGTNIMPAHKLEDFIQRVFRHFKCDQGQDVHGTDGRTQQANSRCLQNLCINVTELIHLVGGNMSFGVTEEQFDNISLVLLHFMTLIKGVCHSYANLSILNLNLVTDIVLSLAGDGLPGQSQLNETGIFNILNTFKNSLAHEEHVHHEHSVDDQAAAPEPHHIEHDEDTHGHGTTYPVIKDKCLSGDALLHYLGEEHVIDSSRIGRLSSLIVYLISEGYEVKDKCRLLPYKEEFINNIFSKYADARRIISVDGLVILMSRLGINPETNGEHAREEAQSHTHRRRSLSSAAQPPRHGELTISSRIRRQVVNNTIAQRCFTAHQIMAIYNAENGVGQSAFQQMCPSLLNQKLFADCSHIKKELVQEASKAEKYGYSTLATVIICLCSVFGVIFIPCVSHAAYNVIMSLFVGLAVGTLFADAILHLIPMVLNVHIHGAEDEHGNDEIVVQKHILYSLAIMAGLYFFYIVEMLMSKIGGHSHNHGSEPSEIMMYSISGGISTTFDQAGEPPKDSSGKNYVVHTELPGMQPDQKSNSRICGLTPIALMIILGDGIHNLADGLAIGASFTISIPTGIATSIAVFCHELPHELGDFAVLLQSGLSFKKALLLNLASALIAFIGLYISLSVTLGEEAKRWIFAVTSGMFLYVALVDLLPQLIQTSGGLHLALNNIGMLIGFAIMFLIAVFEEHIKV